MRGDGAPIDAAGVGTALGVSDDAPSLDSAYKLVEVAGRPVMKLSSGKETLPARKQVWRTDSVADDVLAIRDEPGPPGAAPMLVPVLRDGERLGAAGTIDEARHRLQSDLLALPDDARRLLRPSQPVPNVSSALASLAAALAAAVRGGAFEHKSNRTRPRKG